MKRLEGEFTDVPQNKAGKNEWTNKHRCNGQFILYEMAKEFCQTSCPMVGLEIQSEKRGSNGQKKRFWPVLNGNIRINLWSMFSHWVDKIPITTILMATIWAPVEFSVHHYHPLFALACSEIFIDSKSMNLRLLWLETRYRSHTERNHYLFKPTP